ncbi:TonB-dependent receptor [Bartonella sp. HY761]|uniref:TonB-dependent receptor n=1 Tax=Bartonella sp. HY761 TaxID=2979330 RepID=UPI00220D3167|nr:TonB-dependent siderophore receptor [Bartonella sp. HY761]UXN06275.1 TonB-dependent siderophore receptor [Bartonella sp. HY761]
MTIMPKKKDYAQSRLVNNMAVRLGLAATLTSLPLVAQAQNTNATNANNNNTNVGANNGSTVLETVTITSDTGSINTNNAQTGSSRMPGSVREVPQTVNTVPERIMQEQNVTTLEQALRNVPGITVTTGEGNGGMNGDRFSIRGFETLGDTYQDGLRDFGVYVRDSFNMEQVQVFKGPNGENFGVGTTGGAINTVSKKARLGTFGKVEGTVGNGPLYRSTIDYNKQINDTTAVRFNLMGNWQNIVDRNQNTSDRWGAAASVGFGLGTNQTWHLNYYFQHNDRTPDYGVPFVKTPNGYFYPVTEYGVPRKNFYGKHSDQDKSDIHMVTSNYSNEINDWLTIKNDTRYTHFSRWFTTTPVNCGTSGGLTAGCTAALFGAGGNPVLGIGAGGGPSYDQTSWGIQNVTTAIAKFETGALRHEAVLGLDMMYQKDERQGYRYIGSKATHAPSLWTENFDSSYYQLVPNAANYKDANSRSFAVFLSDRVWLTEQLSILGGVRWDHQKTNYDLTGANGITSTSASADYASPKASLIWEPTKSQNYYVTYSVSKNLPAGQYITSDVNPVSSGMADWKPEKSELWEVGGKLDLFDGNLGLTAAVFQVTKDNSIHSDPDGELTFSGDKERVRGFEAGLTGNITEQWNVYGSYTYLWSRVLDAEETETIGNSVGKVAKNAASIWTTYDLAPHIANLDGKLLIGGGMTYRDAMAIRSDGLARVPHSFTLDALVSYENEKWKISANAYNLTNRLNYDNFFYGRVASSARAIPSSGRSFTLSVAAKF